MPERPVVYDPEWGWYREGDLTVAELLERVERLINIGYSVHVKFTCQNCHSRQVSNTQNGLHTGGYTCEECGQLTHPKRYGFMLVAPFVGSMRVFKE